MRRGVLSATITLSSKVSDTLDISGGVLQAIAVPTVTSGDLFILGSFTTTSADFVRIQNPVLDNPTSGDLRLAIGPGSKMMVWPNNFPSPAFIRLETAVAQAAARVFSVRFGS